MKSESGLLKEPWRFLLFTGGLAFCIAAAVQFYHRRPLLGAAGLFLMYVCWHFLGRPDTKGRDDDRK